jgi:NTE family protein
MLNVIREQISPVPQQQSRPLPYDVVALVLQGGGALGAYQAGVYDGLHEAGIRPNWLAGISIGALNAAMGQSSRATPGRPLRLLFVADAS